jgi:hypothetical protein
LEDYCSDSLTALQQLLPKVEDKCFDSVTDVLHVCDFYQDCLMGGFCPHAPLLFVELEQGTSVRWCRRNPCRICEWNFAKMKLAPHGDFLFLLFFSACIDTLNHSLTTRTFFIAALDFGSYFYCYNNDRIPDRSSLVTARTTTATEIV